MSKKCAWFSIFSAAPVIVITVATAAAAVSLWKPTLAPAIAVFVAITAAAESLLKRKAK